MNKKDFIEWKNDPRTIEVFQVVKSFVHEWKYNLAAQAGLDSSSDRFKAGRIEGAEQILNIDWEEEENVEDQGA